MLVPTLNPSTYRLFFSARPHQTVTAMMQAGAIQRRLRAPHQHTPTTTIRPTKTCPSRTNTHNVNAAINRPVGQRSMWARAAINNAVAEMASDSESRLASQYVTRAVIPSVRMMAAMP